MNIEDILAKMATIVATADAEQRAMSDEEVVDYEKLEKDLALANKTNEIAKRQKAYEAPSFSVITPTGKGDEVLERAFEDYLRTGQKNMDIVELRAQSTSDSAGGYSIPPGFRQKLTDRLKAFGGIRSLAEVISTDSGNAIEWPTVDDTANTGVITAEGSAQGSAGADLVFGTKTLGAFKYTSAGTSNAPIKVSVELLQDSAFDVGAFVSKKLGERIARKQASDFAVGVGTTAPLGLATTTADQNDGGTTLTYAKLLAATHDVDVAYRDSNCRWVMNDSTLEEIEGLVDSTGRPLLQRNNDAGFRDAVSAGTLLGYAVTIDNGVVTTSGYNYLMFGNIREAYVIREVKDVTVLVDPYSSGAAGQVEYSAWARADGTIQNRNAYATIKSHRVA